MDKYSTKGGNISMKNASDCNEVRNITDQIPL